MLDLTKIWDLKWKMWIAPCYNSLKKYIFSLNLIFSFLYIYNIERERDIFSFLILEAFAF